MSSFTTSHKFATSWENSQSQLPIVSLSSHGFRQVLGQRLFLHPGQMAFAGPMMSTSLVSKDIRHGNNLFFPELSHFDVNCLIDQDCNFIDLLVRLYKSVCDCWIQRLRILFFIKKSYLFFLLHASVIKFPLHLSIMNVCKICVLF